jgi:PAS domain S-box-containing protein
MFEDHKAAMLFIQPTTGKIIDANPAAVKFYGYTKDILCSMEIQDIVQTSSDEYRIEQQVTDKDQGHFIFPHKLSNREIRIVEVYSSSIVIKKKPLLFQIIHDVTERRQAEIKLELSEQKYRELVEVQQELIVRVDIEGRFNFVNEAYCRKFGINRDDLIGKKSFKPLVYPDDLPVTLMKMKELESPPYRVKIEQRAYTTDGLRWIEWDDTAIMDHSGMIVEIQGVGRDIHERKQAEEALRESEERFRNLADSMPQIVWTANPDGSVDYYNNRVTELEGISRNSDGSWKWVPVLHEDDIQPTVEAWNKSFNSGEYYEITHRVKTRNGKYKWLLSRAYPIKNSEGGIIKWYGTATDINEQKETEKALELALLELKRSNKELEQFAYTASHDLQEPIRMIRSYAQLLDLKNKKTMNKPSREYLKFIMEGASRMQQLINDLLIYSRVSTTRKYFEDVDCALILKDVLEDLKFRIQEENAVIEAGSMPVVKGDRTQLRQLFQNLIQNAVKFRCENNPEIKITSIKDNGSWLFSVTDNGIGIDPKFHERIFVIFQRLNPREKYPGTGVGLAICKKIVESHGGRIYVKSEVNKGATFYFTIPA